MKDLTTFYKNNITEVNENLYLYFCLGNSKYAINTMQVVEIIKLPLLDYPQKLANNVVGLLNYNNFTINVLDLRFYLDIKVTPYSVANQILVVKTDESIFGLIIDKVEDIISFEQSKVEPLDFFGKEKIIEFIYKKENESISIINLNTLENIVKKGVLSTDIDIPSLFPSDDDSRYKFRQRSQALQEKFDFNLATNIFSQDKFISFALADSIYCINFEYIKEFLKDFSITKVPCNLDYIAGIIALRGDFVSVIDTKIFLGLLDDIQVSKDIQSIDYIEGKNNIIILETPDFKIGFLVDEIFDIVNIPDDLIKRNTHNQNKYFSSEVIMENKLYTILDIKNILTDERFFVEEG